MPIGPNGERLPYPGDPGFESMTAGPPGMPPPGTMTAGPPGMAPPESIDGPQDGGPPLGVSLNPAQMAAMAMQAIATMAELDQAQLEAALSDAMMQFTAQQQAAMAQVPDALAAILGQLAGPPPESIDGPIGATMPMEAEEPPLA